MIMTTSITIEKDIHFRHQTRGRHELREGVKPLPAAPTPKRIPRVARLMALAIRLDGLVRAGQVRDHADLARLGQVTRARISQILSLVHLAPDIQEEILLLQGGSRGADLLLTDLRPITVLTDWVTQRRRWRKLLRTRVPRP
jgi:hypothetical protein